METQNDGQGGKNRKKKTINDNCLKRYRMEESKKESERNADQFYAEIFNKHTTQKKEKNALYAFKTV